MLAARGPGIYQPNGMGLSEIPALPVLRPVRDKVGHKVGSNLWGFLFGYVIGRILVTDLKDVFQSVAIFRCASVSKTVRPTAPKGQQESDWY